MRLLSPDLSLLSPSIRNASPLARVSLLSLKVKDWGQANSGWREPTHHGPTPRTFGNGPACVAQEAEATAPNSSFCYSRRRSSGGERTKNTGVAEEAPVAQRLFLTPYSAHRAQQLQIRPRTSTDFPQHADGLGGEDGKHQAEPRTQPRGLPFRTGLHFQQEPRAKQKIEGKTQNFRQRKHREA